MLISLCHCQCLRLVPRVCLQYAHCRHYTAVAEKFLCKSWPRHVLDVFKSNQAERRQNWAALRLPGSRRGTLQLGVVDTTVLNNDVGVLMRPWTDASPIMSARLAFICDMRQLQCVRRSLDSESAATVVYAFITSRIDYCNAMLAGKLKAAIGQAFWNVGCTSCQWHDRDLLQLKHVDCRPSLARRATFARANEVQTVDVA